jgi:hypothetical protein
MAAYSYNPASFPAVLTSAPTIMNLANRIKRFLLALALVAGSATLWFVVPVQAGQVAATPTPCPLPESAATSADSSSNSQSPENPQPYMAVRHNPGQPSEKILCLPESAADAHIRHGDIPLGPCPKPGNVK